MRERGSGRGAGMTLHLMERVAVEDDGDGSASGEPVFCVHGLGGSSNTWTPMMPALARHRVLRIDLPGSGLSQRAEGALSLSRFVDAALMACERLASGAPIGWGIRWAASCASTWRPRHRSASAAWPCSAP